MKLQIEREISAVSPLFRVMVCLAQSGEREFWLYVGTYPADTKVIKFYTDAQKLIDSKVYQEKKAKFLETVKQLTEGGKS